jgi:hypothetical protein
LALLVLDREFFYGRAERYVFSLAEVEILRPLLAASG